MESLQRTPKEMTHIGDKKGARQRRDPTRDVKKVYALFISFELLFNKAINFPPKWS